MSDNYDSFQDTLEHIRNVQELLTVIIQELQVRMVKHDQSKLLPPEKEIFDKYTPKLAGTTYGSDEYKQYLGEMKSALRHHYAQNTHHPEHYPLGINDMTLIDIIEMFCDWKASTMRHNDGDLKNSIDKNKERFALSEQLTEIFHNTREDLNW